MGASLQVHRGQEKKISNIEPDHKHKDIFIKRKSFRSLAQAAGQLLRKAVLLLSSALQFDSTLLVAAQLCSTNKFREFWHNNNNLLWVYFLYKYGNLDFSRRGWYPKLMDELKICSKIPVGAILNVVFLLVHFLWLSRLQASAIIFGKSWEFVDSITVSLFVCVFF